MYEIIKQKIAEAQSTEEKINKTREFLQIAVLKILFDRNHFDNIAFVGGTALRILYDLRRYSEDLDFSLISKNKYSFRNLLHELTYELKNYGFKIESTLKDKGPVNASMIKFPELLNDLGLSRLKAEKLSIKLEIDTNPPAGWVTALTPISESFVFAVKHFDPPSLFATKLHACFFRRYTKGRDFYDLVWYLGKKVKPNYLLLNNAIRQTEKKDYAVNPDTIKGFINKKLESVDFKAARKDVERFLENKNELKMLDIDMMRQLVDSSTSF